MRVAFVQENGRRAEKLCWKKPQIRPKSPRLTVQTGEMKGKGFQDARGGGEIAARSLPFGSTTDQT